MFAPPGWKAKMSPDWLLQLTTHGPDPIALRPSGEVPVTVIRLSESAQMLPVAPVGIGAETPPLKYCSDRPTASEKRVVLLMPSLISPTLVMAFCRVAPLLANPIKGTVTSGLAKAISAPLAFLFVLTCP